MFFIYLDICLVQISNTLIELESWNKVSKSRSKLTSEKSLSQCSIGTFTALVEPPKSHYRFPIQYISRTYETLYRILTLKAGNRNRCSSGHAISVVTLLDCQVVRSETLSATIPNDTNKNRIWRLCIKLYNRHFELMWNSSVPASERLPERSLVAIAASTRGSNAWSYQIEK